jgi:acetate kinase
LHSAAEIEAIGFKAVHGGRAGGVREVNDEVLAAMAEMNPVAPAHNPPYIAAMRQLREAFPQLPLVAAFETGFHATIPAKNRAYAVPHEWRTEYGVQRWGFHGASHRYVATRAAEILGRNDGRVISCHLGGSSSICAIRGGESLATSMGMSPQSGLVQNNRVGDFDPFALLQLRERTGKSFEVLLEALSNKSGLLGLSGVSNDLRDVRAAAKSGNEHAKLAIDVYVTGIRHYIGAYLVELGGVDMLAFAGGIGQHDAELRAAVCAGLEPFGVVLSTELNHVGGSETALHDETSAAQIWTIATNEELVVARQTFELLNQT